jgi:DNA-binding HxlR family transcriptional regulator
LRRCHVDPQRWIKNQVGSAVICLPQAFGGSHHLANAEKATNFGKVQTEGTTPTEDERTCQAVQRAAEIVGQRWAASILAAGTRGARRFTEYRAMVNGISDKVLAQRLKDLEAQGLIERTVIPSTPVQILYSVTPDGHELISLLRPVVTWSRRRRHTALHTTTPSTAK